jgi:hypothetical protein
MTSTAAECLCRRSIVTVAGGSTALWVAGGLVSAGVAAAAVGGMFKGDNPQLLIRSGMNKFRQVSAITCAGCRT